jgi:hypothetical protein
MYANLYCCQDLMKREFDTHFRLQTWFMEMAAVTDQASTGKTVS